MPEIDWTKPRWVANEEGTLICVPNPAHWKFHDCPQGLPKEHENYGGWWECTARGFLAGRVYYDQSWGMAAVEIVDTFGRHFIGSNDEFDLRPAFADVEEQLTYALNRSYGAPEGWGRCKVSALHMSGIVIDNKTGKQTPFVIPPHGE